MACIKACFEFLIPQRHSPPLLSCKKEIKTKLIDERKQDSENEEGSENNVRTSPEAPEDGRKRELIEKVAAIVAMNPASELFFLESMAGDDEAFAFVVPSSDHHVYYRHRVQVLRQKARLSHT